MARRIIKAFWGSGSAPARRVLLALEEKGLAYESHEISFSNKDHKTPEYLALNPRGKVPVLVDGDIPLYESLAILHYLEFAYPDHPLFPLDNRGRALTLTKTHEQCYFEEALSGLLVHQRAENKNEEWKTKNSELRTKLLSECKYWNDALQGKKFIAGDNVSFADIAFFPNLDFAVRFGLTFNDYPSLGEYHKSFSSRPSAAKTYPPHWKTNPPPASAFH